MITKNPHFPFKTKLCLGRVVTFWRNKLESLEAGPLKAYIAEMLGKVDLVPALSVPIEDYNIIEENRDLVDFILSALIPYSAPVDSAIAIIEPYTLNLVGGTPQFIKRINEVIANKHSKKNVREDRSVFAAYGHILYQFYDLDVGHVCFGNFIIKNEKSGLEQTYRIDFDNRFSQVNLLGELPELTMEQREEITQNPHNFKRLMELIPPDIFEFQGVVILTAVDITEDESLNTIKRNLMDRDTILETEKFEILQHHMRILLNQQDMHFHIVALRDNEVLLLNTGAHKKMAHYCVYNDSQRFKMDAFHGSLYERMIQLKTPVVIENLEELKSPSRFEKEKLAKGIKSMIMVPLFLGDNLVGALSFSSQTPRAFSPADVTKIKTLISDFALAVKRSIEEFDNTVQRMIQKQYTAIHPAVEWKFKEQAVEYIGEIRQGLNPDVKPIIFENVFPLYSATDIRSSSTYRNKAIQEDLIEHLELAKQIVARSNELKPLPVFDELGFRIKNHLDVITSSLDTGDELKTITFLREEIETHFSYLETLGADIKNLIAEYNNALDGESGSFYKKRKAYDDSVDAINHAISEYVDAAQIKAQEMFPHYFDRYSTDGVDQSIYIGASMAEKGDFDTLHLKNLRLWQLIVLANIARNMNTLKQTLPIPLDTTHLLVVQNVPLTICFHLEEKRFRVDGAYNIRYEIMKKRIDKAVIKGTGERLTQPGKIAIVYSQDSEAAEYEKYIDYMHARGYFSGETEYLSLEDLQGIKGLKALRISINNQKEIDQGGSVMEIAQKLQKNG